MFNSISKFLKLGAWFREISLNSLKILSLVLGIFIAISHARANNQIQKNETFDSQEIDFYLSQLSLEQKVSQMLIFGFAGTEYNQSMGPRLRSYSPGAMIVFQRNIKNPWALANMTYQAQIESIKATGLPSFIMIDQEGGQVTRIKTRPPAPSALSLGQTNNSKLVKSVGYVTGRILELAGVNFNLAPVMDLSNPSQKSFIGNRSFGNSPQKVTEMTNAFSSGLLDAGIIPAAKHFPGHGGISQDSHKGATIKRESSNVMFQRDLVPFQSFIRNFSISAIMVAHVSYPGLDDSKIPATYSKKIVTNLLRDRMGYNGLVITDDLEMLGAAKIGTIEERAIQAVEAGADLIMIAWSRKKQIRARNALISAVKSGRLKMSRIEDSLRRIIKAKLAIKKSMITKPISLSERKKKIDFYADELKILVSKISKINFANSLKNFSPIDAGLPANMQAFVFAADVHFFNSFKQTFDNPSHFIPISPKNDGNVYGYLAKHPNRIAVYYATGTLSAKFAQRIHPSVRDRVFIVNSNYPGLIKNQHSFAGVFHLNTRDFQAGAHVAEYFMQARNRLRKPASNNKSFVSKRGRRHGKIKKEN